MKEAPKTDLSCHEKLHVESVFKWITEGWLEICWLMAVGMRAEEMKSSSQKEQYASLEFRELMVHLRTS